MSKYLNKYLQVQVLAQLWLPYTLSSVLPGYETQCSQHQQVEALPSQATLLVQVCVSEGIVDKINVYSPGVYSPQFLQYVWASSVEQGFYTTQNVSIMSNTTMAFCYTVMMQSVNIKNVLYC